MKKFVLIDGNSLINRAFYATPVLTAPDGSYTNAVYAFLNMLIKLIGDVKPEYLLVAFDVHAPTFRHEAFSDYKGTRKPMPEELRPQIPLLKDVLDKLGIARFEQAGIEADDIIGTLAKKFDLETYIVTGDKDSFQLVDDTTSVYFTKRGITDIDVYNAGNFKEKTGIEPKQIIDLKALMGDHSDNIPGVPGIGEKTGLELVQRFGDIDNLYDNIDQIKGKLKDKLEEGKDTAYLSKYLATIKLDVPVHLSENDLTFDYPFSSSAKDIFIKLGFKNLLKKDGLFDEKDEVSPIAAAAVERVTISNENDITPFVKGDKFAVNIDDFVSFYNFNGSEVFLRIKEGNIFDEGFFFEEAVRLLRGVFENENNVVYVYGLKSLLHLMTSLNIEPKARFEDTALIKYLVDFSSSDDKIKDILEYYSLPTDTPAYSAYKLFEDLYERADEKERKLYNEIELPLSYVLFDMEKTGFAVDHGALEDMSAHYGAVCDKLKDRIIALAGEDFNINSTKQLSHILFDRLGLKHGKKGKTGNYSTNVDILEDLSDQHEIIPLILEYRKYAKLLSTYIEGFKPLIDKKNSLVHTTFYQTQTTTGRLSSRKPNLQNIPVRDEDGKVLRKLFIARSSDRVLVDADYSQIELRLLAAYSGCQKMIDAFNGGRDFHTETAATVFGVPVNDVTPSMRKTAKAVNFGIIYGISDYGLADNLKISPKAAGEFIKKYFETYPEVRAFMDNNVLAARKNGYAVTYFGRKRVIREINASNYNLRSFGERAAMNMPLQGTAADIIKIAMINVFDRLKNEGLEAKLVLQVHDELIIDAPIAEKETVERIIKEEMEGAVSLPVTLVAEVSSGKSWFECK